MTIWMPNIENRRGPRYLAIADALADDIKTGAVLPGDRLPTHRELAYQLGVTVGTVSRAYHDAERRGLTQGEVGRGTFVRGPIPEAAGEDGFFKIEGEQTTISGRDLSQEGPSVEGPEIIDFGLNMPAAGNRAEIFSRTITEIARSPELDQLLGYQTEGGTYRHRAAGAAWLKRSGLAASADRMIICNGAQHALTTVLMALAGPGESIAAEYLTYPAIQGLAHHLGLKLEALDMDEEGLIPDAFERLCRSQPPKLLYCLTTLQNPTTAVMPEARRQAIAAIAEKYNVTIIDDDVYGYLLEDAPPPLSVFAPDQSVYITGAAKFMAPGLRIGYVLAPENLVDRCRNTLNLTSWMAPPFMAEVASRWIENGAAEEFTLWHRREASRRQAIVKEILPASLVQTHPASYHLWLRLPDNWRANAFVSRAKEAGVSVLSSANFSIDATPSVEAVRVCLGPPDDVEQVEKGLAVLADLLKINHTVSAAVF